MNYNVIKSFTLLLLLLSLSFAGEKRINRIVERFQEFEGHYTKPAVGCCHVWNVYRRPGYTSIEQIHNWDSLPKELATNVETYLDSVLGSDWQNTLHFHLFDISEKMHYTKDGSKSHSYVTFNMWFTYNTADTTYYTYISTGDTGTSPHLDNKGIFSRKPHKIRSIAMLWKEKVEAGELPKRAKPSEVVLNYNRLTKEFCWRVCYDLGPIRFIGPTYMVKLNPYTGEILSKRKL